MITYQALVDEPSLRCGTIKSDDEDGFTLRLHVVLRTSCDVKT